MARYIGKTHVYGCCHGPLAGHRHHVSIPQFRSLPASKQCTNCLAYLANRRDPGCRFGLTPSHATLAPCP